MKQGSADLLSKVRGFSRPHPQEPQTSEKRGLRYPLRELWVGRPTPRPKAQKSRWWITRTRTLSFAVPPAGAGRSPCGPWLRAFDGKGDERCKIGADFFSSRGF